MSSSRWRPAARITSVGSPASRKRSSGPSAASLLTPGRRRNSPAGAAPAKRSRTCRSARPVMSSTDSTAASRPSRRMPTRSHIRSTSARLWEERNTVVPSARSSPTRRANSSCMSGSSPAVGSSITTTGGRCTSAWMRPIFCRFPRESSPSGRRRSASKRVGERAGEGAVVDPAEVGEEIQQLLAGDLLVEGELAGQEARAGPRGDAVAPRRRSRGSRAVPEVGRSRPSSVRIVVVLPAPLGPRKPNTSPGATLKRDVLDAARALVALGQCVGGDGRRHHLMVRSSAARTRIRIRPPCARDGLRSDTAGSAR